MENSEEILQVLERYTRLKQKDFPKELDDYLYYVAKSGDTVYKWANLKYLFREKLFSVIKTFHETTPRLDDLPQYPNVDPFNYESMKSSLIERLDLFNAAPFTVQRLCELLIDPRKQYGRVDKFMRALEKNILVVSTIEPGRKRTESENADSVDSIVNGDTSLDVNVDIVIENSQSLLQQSSSNLIVHKLDQDILPNPKKVKLDVQDLAANQVTAKGTETFSKPTDECKEEVEISPSLNSKNIELSLKAAASLSSNPEFKTTAIRMNVVSEKSDDNLNDKASAGMNNLVRKSANELQKAPSDENNQRDLGINLVSGVKNVSQYLDNKACTQTCSSSSFDSGECNDEEHVGIIKRNEENQPEVLKSFENTDLNDKKPIGSKLKLIEVEDNYKDCNPNETKSEKTTVAIDQPMEDNSEIREAVSSSEAVLVHNSLSSSEILINEIVDMATDTIEVTKDETAGMDIDDNSQEAMDQ